MEKFLIVSFEQSPRAYLGPAAITRDGLVIGGRRVWASEAPWPFLCDILFHPDSREFVGVTYYVPKDLRAEVRRIVGGSDAGALRYRDCAYDSTETARDPEYQYLEVIWKDAPGYLLRDAQLVEGNWFYEDPRCATTYYPVGLTPIAFGLWDVDDVLRSFDLDLPKDWDLPVLDVHE